MNTALGRTEIAYLTNKSGGSVAQGDVVIVDTANASAFTTTTSGADVSGRIGVVLEPNGIASNASGLVAFSGYVPVINLSGTGSIGDLVKTHTVAKQGVRHAAPQVAGDFAQVLGTTATPVALLFGTVQLGGGSGSASRTLITEATPSGTGTVTFSSIPGTYKSLEIDFVVRSAKTATADNLLMEFNADTTAANYRAIKIIGYDGNSMVASGSDDRFIANVSGASSPSNSACSGRIVIPFYALTTFNKTSFCNWAYREDASSVHAATGQNGIEWENAAAITQVVLKLASDNFVTGSTLRLYGVS